MTAYHYGHTIRVAGRGLFANQFNDKMMIKMMTAKPTIFSFSAFLEFLRRTVIIKININIDNHSIQTFFYLLKWITEKNSGFLSRKLQSQAVI